MAAQGSSNEINILKEGKEIRLNLPVLEDVLCQTDIADSPLAVVGIAGPAGSGKSFLMSFLLRYLQYEGWNTREWIEDDQALLNKGFSWKSGVDSHTTGIRFWKEIFKIKLENGEELPVLLVDTQGLYDKDMSKEDDIKLFVLTIMLCSHLLLNFENRLNEKDLESLEFFIQYAKDVQQKGDVYDFIDSKCFQSLTFLVRNWQNSKDFIFGAKGGNKYVNSQMEMTTSTEANFVRENIGQTFKKCGGFLMPHPGLLAVDPDFDGRIADVNLRFRESVLELASAVLHPQNLEARIYNGEMLTGRQLYKLLEECGKAFHSGEAPKVENMWTMTSRMNAAMAYEYALGRFEKNFREALAKT